ncbi:MAG: phosphodiesterase [Candidatus Hydrogenedentota bacterium]
MLRRLVLFIAGIALSTPIALGDSPVRHVVIVGIDGLSPKGIAEAETPNMDLLMRQGSWTFAARAVMPTSSSSNWASMIMGAGPEQHGVTSNDWQPDIFEITPIAKGPGGIFPTLFSVIRQAHAEADIACFHDWAGFGRLFEKNTATHVSNPVGPKSTTKEACDYIESRKPLFTFIHLDHVDHAGHDQGWHTEPYFAAVREADEYVGLVVQSLQKAAILNDTILIITSDHGGKGKGHGGATMEEILIPWIIRGPGVAQGKELVEPVNTYDTAATVAYVLGITPPSIWIAKPVLEAFKP